MRRSIYNPGFYVELGGYSQRIVYYTYDNEGYWMVYNHYDEGTESPLWTSYLSGNGFLKEDIKNDYKEVVQKFNKEVK